MWLTQPSLISITSLPITTNALPQGVDQESSLGQVFYGTAGTAGVAAQSSYVQLFNPVGSTVIVYVDKMWGIEGAAVFVNIQQTASDLGGAAGTITPGVSGGAAGQATIKVGTSAAISNAPMWSQQMVVGALGLQFLFRNPYRLNAGKGVLMWGSSVNNSLNASIRWREK